jgi:hypothetical protein
MRLWHLALLVVAVSACVRNVDLTPAASNGTKPKPDGASPVVACTLDGGVCPQLSPACAREKEACATPAECCSGRCEVKTAESGTCKLLPACRVSYESCTLGTECCSGLCVLVENAGGRCEPAAGCASVGERCATSSQCCSAVCRASPEGVLRCAGGKCKALGETCAKSDECCDKDPSSCRAAEGAGLRCLGAPGVLGTCFADGAACAVPEQCCTGACMASPAGLLTCGLLSSDPTVIP